MVENTYLWINHYCILISSIILCIIHILYYQLFYNLSSKVEIDVSKFAN